MSKVKYCSECGNKIEFNYSPPKFCSNCGESLGGTVKQEIKANKRKRNIRSEEVEEGFTNSQEVPDIDRLDLDIEFSNNVISLNGDNDKGLYFSNSKFKPRSKSI